MIQFYRGLKSKYNYPANTNLLDAIFFAEDTGELLVNGVNYGVDNQKIKDVVFDSNTNTFTFTKGDDTTLVVNLGDRLLTDSDKSALASVKDILESGELSVVYTPGVDDSIATVEKLGGIEAGTTAGSLKNKTISAVLDQLIFPTVLPTATQPSVSLSLKSGVANVREVGSAAPVRSNFTASWNPGTIKIGNAVQADRAGEKTSDIVYAGTEANEVTETAGTVAAGTTNYYYKVNYAQGPTPVDSKGNAATTLVALPAGSKTSSAVAIYGVYPFYGTTTAANIQDGTVTKLPLTNSTSFILKLAAENPNKHVIKIPHTITKIETLNTLSNQYEVFGLENFTITTEQISVQGVNKEYKVYTRNDAGFIGEVTYRITYSK